MPHDEATAELAQRNISSSGGFYDAERTFGGEVFNLRAHLDRLYESLDFANMDAGMDIEQMEAVTVEVLSSNRPQRRDGEEFTLTQIVARADGENGGAGSTSVAILCEQLDFSAFASGYRDGVRVITPITYPVPRQTGQNGLQESSDPYLLVTGAKGHVTECLHADFMFADKGRVKLPDTQKVLPGVSMATVLEIAASAGIPVDEGDYSALNVYESDEAFVSSTRFCIQPVATLNGVALGEGVPGPVTAALTEAWSDLVGLDFVAQATTNLSGA